MSTAPTNVIWVSESGRPGAAGTAADPFGSIQAAINLANPGTTIMVKAGTYTENLDIKLSGTAAAPIRIVSADGPGLAEIKPASQSDDTIQISRADHVIIDGFKVIGPSNSLVNAVHIHAHISGDIFDPATNVVVQNCDITAGRGDGIKVSKAEYISLLNNKIVGSAGTEEGIDAVGAHHLVIANNSVSGSGGIGIGVKGGSYDVLIEGNHVDGTAAHGIGVGGYTEEAYFWPGFIGSQAYEVKDVRVVGNEIENTTGQGIRVMGGQDVEIESNWIHDVAHQYAIGISDVGSTIHNPPWTSGNVVIEQNSFDKAKWLRVDSQQAHAESSGNTTDGQAPASWSVADPAPPVPSPLVVTESTALADDSTILHLVTEKPGKTTAINLSGNDLPQILEGNAGKNILDGKGGADTMYGYGGNDTYYVDSAADRVFEKSGAGTDKVYASVSYSLAAGQAIEWIGALAAGGIDALDLTGNETAQTLQGNAGNNVLNGKQGADKLYGMAGDDTYYVDNSGDRVFENNNSGTDTVLTTTTYVLAGGVSVEKLATTSLSGTGAIKLTGNEYAQEIVGNAGSNVILGKQGNDVLTGGAGADTFVFDTALRSDNVDRITDFSVADDTLRLENNVFRALGKAGALKDGAFQTGTASEADDRIIFDSDTGSVYYDADGSGSGEAILFVRLDPHLALSAADFVII